MFRVAPFARQRISWWLGSSLLKRSLLVSGFHQRRFQSSTTAAILDDEIEILDSSSPEVASSPSTSFAEVQKMDQFARAKVINFIKRHTTPPQQKQPQKTSHYATPRQFNEFEVQEMSSFDGDCVFHAKLKIPLPAEYGELYGEGVAPSRKDAETLAAMHAEHIIDALGMQMYSLGSTQKRHATAAKENGRWAPEPGEAPKPPGTALPPPLKISKAGSVHDDSNYMTAGNVDFSPLRLTLVSPQFVDTGSKARVQSFFAKHGEKLKKSMRILNIEELGDPPKKEFLVQIKLCVPPQYGLRIASGKAPDVNIAVTLACMHAELIIDAIGLSLYPSDPHLQSEHAEECRKVGRWAALPGEAAKGQVQALSPPALKFGKISEAEIAKAKQTMDASFLVRDTAAQSITSIITIDFVDKEACQDLLKFLARQGMDVRKNYPFFSENLGQRMSSTYRASVALPLDCARYGQRVGIGIADTERDAEDVAAMHAIQILGTLGIPIYEDSQQQMALFHRVTQSGGIAVDPSQAEPSQIPPETPSPPPFKLKTRERKRGRVSGNLIQYEIAEDASGAADDPSEEKLAAEIAESRRTGNKSTWSFEPDSGDGFIVIPPTGPSGETFGLTIHSPRIFDPQARLRLVDYLERHGIPSKAIQTVAKNVDGGDQRLFSASVLLPAPPQFGVLRAVGEAYILTEAEAVAGMHAELILDTLGIPFYEYSAYQRKHAREAVKMGRFAPFPNTPMCDPKAVKLPPPIRKESVSSVRWMRQVAKTGDGKGHVAEVGSHDVEKELAALVPFHVNDIVNSVRFRVDQYLRGFGKASHEVSCFSISGGPPMAQFKATLPIPVPAGFGNRLAVGVADTKKNAVLLCMHHFEHTLDALGIRMWKERIKQEKHAAFARADGRYAPGPDAAPRPFQTKSPPGYRIAFIENVAIPPLPRDVDDRIQWFTYVRAATSYIEKKRLAEVIECAMKCMSPRRGYALEDKGLDVVETAPLDSGAKAAVMASFLQRNVKIPFQWPCDPVMTPQGKRFYCAIPVFGTPFLAQGVGTGPSEALNRTAMHLMYIFSKVNALMAHNSDKKVSKTIFDESNEVKAKVKREIIHLYLAQQGLKPPTVTEKDGFNGVKKALVELVDDCGLKIVGRGEDADPSLALEKAYEILFKQLGERQQRFISFIQLVKATPGIKLNCATYLNLESTALTEIAHLFPEHLESTCDLKCDQSGKCLELLTLWKTRKLEVKAPITETSLVASDSSSKQQTTTCRITKTISSIIDSLEKKAPVLACYPLGSGKTTVLPNLLSSILSKHVVVVVSDETTMMIALEKMALERGESVGASVGWIRMSLDICEIGTDINFILLDEFISLAAAAPQALFELADEIIFDEVYHQILDDSPKIEFIVKLLVEKQKAFLLTTLPLLADFVASTFKLWLDKTQLATCGELAAFSAQHQISARASKSLVGAVFLEQRFCKQGAIIALVENDQSAMEVVNDWRRQPQPTLAFPARIVHVTLSQEGRTNTVAAIRQMIDGRSMTIFVATPRAARVMLPVTRVDALIVSLQTFCSDVYYFACCLPEGKQIMAVGSLPTGMSNEENVLLPPSVVHNPQLIQSTALKLATLGANIENLLAFSLDYRRSLLNALLLVQKSAQSEEVRSTPMAEVVLQTGLPLNVARIVTLGRILHCLDSILTIVAASSVHIFGGENVKEYDLLEVLSTFRQWANLKMNSGEGKVASFCKSHGISMDALAEISNKKRELHQKLCDSGAFGTSLLHTHGISVGQCFVDASPLSLHASNATLVNFAVLFSAIGGLRCFETPTTIQSKNEDGIPFSRIENSISGSMSATSNKTEIPFAFLVQSGVSSRWTIVSPGEVFLATPDSLLSSHDDLMRLFVIDGAFPICFSESTSSVMIPLRKIVQNAIQRGHPMDPKILNAIMLVSSSRGAALLRLDEGGTLSSVVPPPANLAELRFSRSQIV